jgi:hypothetical protein
MLYLPPLNSLLRNKKLPDLLASAAGADALAQAARLLWHYQKQDYGSCLQCLPHTLGIGPVALLGHIQQ